MDFFPLDSATGYGWSGTGRKRTNVNGSGYFMCNPSLPTGAVVTKVRFTLLAPAPGSSATKKCGLQRASLSASSMPSAQVMARVPDSESLAHWGLVRLSDSSISHATVDNSRYGYYLQCQLYSDSGDISSGVILGADVTYTISASKG
jgi:hypothetical protein